MKSLEHNMTFEVPEAVSRVFPIEPGDKVGIVKVRCEALADQNTRVAVT